MKTTYVNTSEIAGAIIAGIVAGAAGSSFVLIPTMGTYSGFSSNIVYDPLTGVVYNASVREIVKLNAHGTVNLGT